MLAQGSPVIDHGPRLGRAKSFSPNANVLASMTYKQRVQLNGNGQHMSSIGAFVMFCFAHLMLRDDSLVDPEPLISEAVEISDED
eukprot:13441752-Alexandrium_andersonii.AAC.1